MKKNMLLAVLFVVVGMLPGFTNKAHADLAKVGQYKAVAAKKAMQQNHRVSKAYCGHGVFARNCTQCARINLALKLYDTVAGAAAKNIIANLDEPEPIYPQAVAPQIVEQPVQRSSWFDPDAAILALVALVLALVLGICSATAFWMWSRIRKYFKSETPPSDNELQK